MKIKKALILIALAVIISIATGGTSYAGWWTADTTVSQIAFLSNGNVQITFNFGSPAFKRTILSTNPDLNRLYALAISAQAGDSTVKAYVEGNYITGLISK